ncbi:TfoX/Sxy family protein [Solimicrobium silvestre]|uniref:Regulator of competence-specific protein n=1 Tax=Solimicrobium silvestre TaxID=2099400 RepID=A0A2S9H4K7_9BURK|nr:TfoX/Sxy family protein [Solimicrobium silvestre]PRC94898.1 Regulator of competence-specific protein [Solimicrobium silvestre]
MSSDFVAYVHELLAPLGNVRSKRMFGGVGIYINDLFCALIADDYLYFKGDDENEAEFIAVDCPPFTYEKEGQLFSMRYYRAPDEALDNPHEMSRWARLGLAAALRKAANPKAKAKKAQPKVSKKLSPTQLS